MLQNKSYDYLYPKTNGKGFDRLMDAVAQLSSRR